MRSREDGAVEKVGLLGWMACGESGLLSRKRKRRTRILTNSLRGWVYFRALKQALTE